MSASDTALPLEYRQKILSKKAARGLYIVGLLTLIVISLWFLNEGNWEVDGKTIWGIAIMVLASYPALMWAKRAERWIPTFEVAMLIAIPQYAIPLLSHPLELRFYPETTITRSALVILLYIFLAVVGFSISRRPPRLRNLLSTSLIPNKIYHLSHLGIFISNIYLSISTFSSLIPHDFQRLLSTLFLGLGTISIFITSQLWGLDLLNASKKLFFFFNVLLNILISFTGLYLISGFAMVFLAIVSYSTSKKKIPWVVILVFSLLISILHLGKGKMRGKYWDFSHGRATQARSVEIHEVPSFFAEWINDGLAMDRESKHSSIDQNSSLERASLFPMVCLAVDRIPREKGYLMGDSYTSIPVLLIPRILWPQKPSALDSNDRLMIHLGLVNPNNITVNIALGLPTEAYINFGFIGVGTLGLLLGFLYKKISLISQNSPQFSAIGILSILMIASVSQSDQNAAIWISALFQMSVICIGIPLIYNIINSQALLPKGQI